MNNDHYKTPSSELERLENKKAGKFSNHIAITRILYVLLAINSLIGLLTIGFMLVSLQAQHWSIYVVIAFLMIILLVNTYCAYQIYFRNYKALKICAWLYALQIFGFNSNNFQLYFHLGISVTASMEIFASTIIINIAAIIISLLATLSIRSVFVE